jgi:AmmeMemoRadiSam system protein B
MSSAPEPIRPAAVAGTWYPGDPTTLASEVDGYLDAVVGTPRVDVAALVSPHAGLVYSGPVAAYSYAALQGKTFDVAVLVGPSHFVGFDGVSIYGRGSWLTPFGHAIIETDVAARLEATSSLITSYPRAHEREHSLELQLPFLQRLLPETPIVPLVIGYQHRDTILGLSDALATVLSGTDALIVASTDLSHYFDASQAAILDGRVTEHVARFDWSGLMEEFERYPEHERGRCVACGGGAAIAVMRAAQMLGATAAQVLKRSDSAEVSGDSSRVVGYLAAVFGAEVAHAGSE